MSLSYYVDPRGTTPIDWCDRMVPVLEQFGPIPKLFNSDWKTWARDVIDLSEISSRHPPKPDVYTNFVEWALDFNFALAGG